MKPLHKPVLLKETIDFLITNKSGKYFEATAGFGGHSEAILKALNYDGVLVSTDLDEKAFLYCRERFAEDSRIRLYQFNYELIDVIAKIESILFFDGVFADLGVSSVQLDDSAAGFSYSSRTNLDLRFDKKLRRTAADVINETPEDDLAGIIYSFGEEHNSRKIARAIVETRGKKKITKTDELKSIIYSVTNPRYQVKTLSRVFQALRIFVNDELRNLKLFLENSVNVLKKGGRLVIISYHSLEDRIVKELFKYENLKCICPPGVPVCKCKKEQRLKIITKKPVTPSINEIKFNRRARSARLRVAERL